MRSRSRASGSRPRWNRSLCTSAMTGRSSSRKSTRPIQPSSPDVSTCRRIGARPARWRIWANRPSRLDAGGTWSGPRASTSDRNTVSPRRPCLDMRRSTAASAAWFTSRSDHEASIASPSRSRLTCIPDSCSKARAGDTTWIPSSTRISDRGRNRTSWRVAPRTGWSSMSRRRIRCAGSATYPRTPQCARAVVCDRAAPRPASSTFAIRAWWGVLWAPSTRSTRSESHSSSPAPTRWAIASELSPSSWAWRALSSECWEAASRRRE